MTATLRLVDPPQPPAGPKSEPWMEHAACVGADTELFFPGRGENDTVANAKAVCAGCEVRSECLDYALANNEKQGVWGGTSERERRQMRRFVHRPVKDSNVVLVARALSDGSLCSVEDVRVRIGRRSHSGIAEALRKLMADGTVVKVRESLPGRPALYQICGGEPSP